MIAVQEMCGRVGVITGNGIAAVIREYYPKWLLYGSLGLLFLANTLNVYADLNMMAASAKMLLGSSQVLWLTLITVTLISLGDSNALSRLLASVEVSLRCLRRLRLCRHSARDPYELGKGISQFGCPFVEHEAGLPTGHGRISWHDDLSLFVLLASAVKRSKRLLRPARPSCQVRVTQPVQEREIRNVRADTVLGMIASQAVAFFVMGSGCRNPLRFGKARHQYGPRRRHGPQTVGRGRGLGVWNWDYWYRADSGSDVSWFCCLRGGGDLWMALRVVPTVLSRKGFLSHGLAAWC